MARYKPKYKEVLAVRMVRNIYRNHFFWPDWLYNRVPDTHNYEDMEYTCLQICCFDEDCRKKHIVHSMTGPVKVLFGDWILKGPRGNLSVMKNEVFRERYEKIENKL